MKLFTKTLLTAGIALATLPSYAKKKKEEQNKKDLQYGIYTAFGSSIGIGVGGAIRFSPELSLRAAIGTIFPISVPWSSDIDQTTAFAPYYKLKTEEIQIFREQ